MGSEPLISFLVVSVNPENLNRLRYSLQKTVESIYELLVFDNAANQSLAYCYNQLFKQAKADLICCIHDDICFIERGWDNTLVKCFEANADIGILGIAGGAYKSRVFSPAWFNYRNDGHRINIIQPNEQGVLVSWVENPYKKMLSEVVVVDGVFMCCRKTVWEQYKFDESVLQGFHFYDMDFCLGVRSIGYKNYVSHEILLEHYSSGTNNLDWYRHGKRVHEKWKHALPQFVGQMTNGEIKRVEYRTLEYVFNLQLKLRSLGDAFMSLCKLVWQKPLKGQNILYLKNWIKQLLYAA